MRKKTNTLLDLQGLPMVAVIALIAFFLINNLEVIGIVFACFSLVGLGIFYLGRQRKRDQILALRKRLKEQVDENENALISYFRQSRSRDQFGNIDDRRWQVQIDTFLRTKVVPQEPNYTQWRKSDLGIQAAAMINRITMGLVDAQLHDNSFAKIDAFELTPSEYEHHCANILKAEGWAVNVTQASRDGGADFYAEKDGIRLVAQCKRYSTPVGNKAVQEVNSALRLYNGNFACVIAPMGFTKQARTEALGHSIQLLHHLELPSFSDKLVDAAKAVPKIR
jgi:restriction system protein